MRVVVGLAVLALVACGGGGDHDALTIYAAA
jgi:hypothetical protein